MGYDSKAGITKHYRVDKMIKIGLLEDKREGKALFEKIDMAVYSKKRFGMFDGREQTVKLECENHFAGVIIDRFGKDVSVRKADDEHFVVNVEVAVSAQFIGWVIALGAGVRVVSPESVIDGINREIDRLIEQYRFDVEGKS